MDKNNVEFSEFGHLIAREAYYKKFYDKGLGEPSCQTIRGYAPDASELEKFLDCKLGVDMIFEVDSIITTRLGTSYMGKRKRTAQERFVRNMRDSITISVQTGSGREGELFRLDLASHFIYGEYNGTEITDMIFITNTTLLADAIFDKKILFTTHENPNNGTIFIAIKIEELDRNNIPYVRFKNKNKLH